MKRLMAVAWLFFFSGCASLHSPYDLYDWCTHMGSARLTSIGPEAHRPAICERELEEDLADRTPKILYVPRDVVMSPVIAGRIAWALLGRTQPPF